MTHPYWGNDIQEGSIHIWQCRSTCCRVPLKWNREHGYTVWFCTKCNKDCLTWDARYSLYDTKTGETARDEYTDMAIILSRDTPDG